MYHSRSSYLRRLLVNKNGETSLFLTKMVAKGEEILQFFHDDYYGQNEFIVTPFSLEKKSNIGNGIDNNYEMTIMYCDWTANGKSLKSVENYIDNNVIVLYAKTHASTSVTGKHVAIIMKQEILY